MTIKEAREELVEKVFNLIFFDEFGNSKRDILRQNTSSSLLYFPRKLLKMRKIESGKQKSRSWFIDERLPETSCSLDEQTRFTNLGLTSGLRSALIREGNNFLRLKGVAPNLQKYQKSACKIYISYSQRLPANEYRGLCPISEALNEQIHSFYLSRQGLTKMKPAFIEFFMHDSRSISEQFDLLTRCHPKLEFSRKNPFNLKNFQKFSNYSHSYFADEPFVSAFYIDADTRLDEAFYHLTKKELTGEKRTTRDDLMKFLSFKAGGEKARLSASGFCWSSGGFDATNNHIGNFIIRNTEGLVSISICDLFSIASFEDFNELNPYTKSFQDYLEKEIDSFKDDFFAESTTSQTTNLRYRHFPVDLRKDCLDCFFSGYANYMYEENEIFKMIIPYKNPERVLMPKFAFLEDSKFREYIDYILN